MAYFLAHPSCWVQAHEEKRLICVVRGHGTLLRGEECVPVEAGDVTHAFIADSGEETEYLSIGERKDNDAVLSTPTRASSWWPGSSARTGSTGRGGASPRGGLLRRRASTARSTNLGEGCITWMTSTMTPPGARQMKWRWPVGRSSSGRRISTPAARSRPYSPSTSGTSKLSGRAEVRRPKLSGTVPWSCGMIANYS